MLWQGFRLSTHAKTKRGTPFGVPLFALVRATGLEPARRGRKILNLMRLPIPPRPRNKAYHTIKRCFCQARKRKRRGCASPFLDGVARKAPDIIGEVGEQNCK